MWKSRRRRRGRPSIDPDVRALIRKISDANRQWGAPRVHGELRKIGIDVSQVAVSKYMVRDRKPRPRHGEAFSTIICASWSPSTSSRCQPQRSVFSLSSSGSATTWIVVFAVSVLGMIDQEMSAALAEALGAITSGHLRARFVPIVKVNVADAIAPLFRHGHDERRVREIAVDRDAVRLHVDDEPVVVVRAFDVDA